MNAMTFVDVTKRHLQKIRDDGWHSHMNKVTSFCVKHDIEIPNMEGMYVLRGEKSVVCKK